MKIKCINVIGLETLLTLGKEYVIENISNRFYIIKNDKGIYSRYTKERFVVVSSVKKEEVAEVHDSKLEEEKTEAIKEIYVDFVTEEEKQVEDLMGIFEATHFLTAPKLIPDCRRVPGDFEVIGTTLGKLVDNKNAQYGDAVKTVGKVLEILYPNGVRLEQYTDLGAIVRVLDKIFRITRGNQGDENAWNDIAGYGILMSKEDK